MRKALTGLLLALTLCSCSAMDALSVLSPDKPSVEVNANVGKNVEQEKSNIKLEQGTQNTKQEAEEISNDTLYTADSIQNITQNIPMSTQLLIIFLAWMSPQPKKIYRGIKVVVGDVVRSVLITPVKAFGGFVLKLAGRE